MADLHDSKDIFLFWPYIKAFFFFDTYNLSFNTHRCDGTVIRQDSSSSFQDLYAEAYGSSCFRPPRDVNSKIG
jgi:hypothetical protein